MSLSPLFNDDWSLTQEGSDFFNGLYGTTDETVLEDALDFDFECDWLVDVPSEPELEPMSAEMLNLAVFGPYDGLPFPQ